MLSNELQIYINSPKQPSISTILTKKTIPAQKFHRISKPGTSTRPPMAISITGKTTVHPALVSAHDAPFSRQACQIHITMNWEAN